MVAKKGIHTLVYAGDKWHGRTTITIGMASVLNAELAHLRRDGYRPWPQGDAAAVAERNRFTVTGLEQPQPVEPGLVM